MSNRRRPPSYDDTESHGFGLECPPTDLSTRGDQVTVGVAIPFLGFILPGQASALNGAEAQQAAWRLVDLFSALHPPRSFEAEIKWSAGQSGGQSVRITVARATRVCVFARAFPEIRLLNRYTAASLPGGHPIHVAVADGMDPTRNQFELTGIAQIETLLAQSLFPTYAERVRFELADSAAYSTSYLKFFDENGVLRSQVFASAQPGIGIPVGDFANMAIKADAPWRLIFFLRI